MSSPYVVQQLAHVCSQHVLRQKILLAPGLRTGYDLTNALARSGIPWANLLVATPMGLAAEQTEALAVAVGARRLPAEGRRRLVENCLQSWPATQRRYFRPPEHRSTADTDSSLVEPLQRTLNALRLAGVLPEHIASHADRTGDAKTADLAELFGAYVRALAADNWWDDAEVLTQAMSLEHAPADTIWMILDETELSPLAETYVRQRCGSTLQRLGRRDYGLRPPATSAASRFSGSPIAVTPMDAQMDVSSNAAADEVPKAARNRPASSPGRPAGSADVNLTQGDLFLDPLLLDPLRVDASDEADSPQPPGPLYAIRSAHHLAPHLATRPAEQPAGLAPGGLLLTTGLTAEHSNRIQLRQVIGLETEIRSVVGEILERGLPLDDVEIVYTAATPYEGLLYDAVQRWHVPADFVAGVPATLTRPGRALHAYLAWLAEGATGTTLARRLQTGDIEWDDSDTRPPAATVARWLLQGRADAGLEGCLQALTRLGRERDDAEFHARLVQARAQLEQLFDLLPPVDATHDLVQADAMVASAVTFLQQMPLKGATAAVEDCRRQREQLIAGLRGLIGLPPAPAPVAQQAQRLAAVVRRLRCDAERSRPGHLRLAALQDAAYGCRRHTYILGLDESRFPGNSTQDPVLLDDERKVLAPQLEQLASVSARATFQLIRVLGSVAGSVTLLASRLHLADGREPYPTPLFDQARRQLGIADTIRGLLPQLDKGRSTDTAYADELETLLAHRRSIDRSPKFAAALAQRYPAVVRGAQAARARQQAAPSRFSGWIAQPDVERLDLLGQRVLSSRMLETLAECPRRYLWRYGLRLTPPDDPEPDPRRWLHPMEMGNLLHGLFLDFMQQLQDERPALAHLPQLQALTQRAIATERERVPVTLEAAYRNDCRRIERAAEIFLQAEAQRLAADSALQPGFFELDFGFDTEVEVRLSHEVAFRLRGRIDRVDAVANGTITAYEIWDYKTGSTFNYNADNLLNGGLTLQWALYAYALPHLVDDAGDVRLSGYFFASDRGAGQRFSDAPPARHELAATLQPLFALARQGLFPAVHKGDDQGGGPCRFCDYKRVCAHEATGAGAAADMHGAAGELAALVEGWADMVSVGRSGSRQTLERALLERGLQPGDIAPEDAARSVADWIKS